MNAPWYEHNCIVDQNGHAHEAGGAYIAEDQTGRLHALCYVHLDPREPLYGTLTTWHGERVTWCYLGPIYRSNMGDKRRAVWATICGRRMYGTWYSIDWRQCVTLREVA